jgi:hypothetical protein
MRYVLALLLASACLAAGGEEQGPWRKHHNVSLAVNALAAGADMWTTNRLTRTGRYVEANPLVLGLQDGHFGARAVAVNGSIVAASALVQKLVARRHPGAAKWFAVLNYANAGVHAGAAVRNLRMR